MNPSELSVETKLVLHTGSLIPNIGFGCAEWGSTTDSKNAFANKLSVAFEAGYRFLDCAYKYGTDTKVGEFAVPLRSELFILTKFMEYEEGDTVETVLPKMRECVARICPAMEKPCVDLFLIHEPIMGQKGREILWEALVQLQSLGETKDIGVSNFGVKHLKTLPGPKPTVNQVELHPWCQHRPLMEYCKDNGIILQAYAPNARNHKAEDSVLKGIAMAIGKTTTQVLLRWSIQHGFIPIPKSDNRSRIASNIDLYDFELSEEQMTALDALGSDGDKPVCKTYDDFCD